MPACNLAESHQPFESDIMEQQPLTPITVRCTEIPNTHNIPTPPTRASTQSPSQNSSVAAVDGSQSSFANVSTNTSTAHHPETSRDQRLQIQTALLFNIPYKDIRKKLGVTDR